MRTSVHITGKITAEWNPSRHYDVINIRQVGENESTDNTHVLFLEGPNVANGPLIAAALNGDHTELRRLLDEAKS